MSNEEAYELLVKYSGEQGILMQKEMLRQVGVKSTFEMIKKSYGKKLPHEFKSWMKQALEYLNNKMSEPLN